MSWEAPILDVTLPASADMSGNQFRVVSLTTAGRVQLMTSFLDVPVGVLQDKTTGAGQACKVRVSGITKVVAGGSSGRNRRWAGLGFGRPIRCRSWRWPASRC